jgi:hypothetical protein
MKLKAQIFTKSNKIKLDFSEIKNKPKTIYGHLAKMLMGKDMYSTSLAKQVFIMKGMKNENPDLKQFADLGIAYEPLIIDNILKLFPNLERVNNQDKMTFEQKKPFNEFVSENGINLGRMIDLETKQVIFEIKTVTANENFFYDKALAKLDDYISQMA